MVLFQSQTTQVKGKYLKKQINCKVLGLFLITILFSKNLVSEELNKKIITYLQGLNSFSSNFIQSDGIYLDQGYIYIKNDMIRLDYTNPDRTLKISKEKGVYINHELREEEFFSTKKNIVRIFYDLPAKIPEETPAEKAYRLKKEQKKAKRERDKAAIAAISD